MRYISTRHGSQGNPAPLGFEDIMLAGLARGDEVVTSGGLAGRIVEIGDSFVELEIADKVVAKVQKQALGAILPKGTLKKKA